MRLRRYWPGYALLLAAVVGGAFLGVGGAVGALTLATLVVGPAYLIQQRVRRRRGVEPTGRRLDRDADEAMTALAVRFVVAIHRSWRLRLAYYAGGVLIFGFVWLWAGPGWALAPVGLSLLATAIGIARRRLR